MKALCNKSGKRKKISLNLTSLLLTLCQGYIKEVKKNLWCLFECNTILQKLSKCEVKAWLCWNLIILLPLRFYVETNFGKFKRSKNVIFFAILELLNFDISKFEQLSSPKFTKIQSSEALKLPKMTLLDRLNSPKFYFT